MSIQTRLTVAVALVLALTFGLLGVVQVRNTRATLVGQVDRQARENAVRNLDRVKHERRGSPGYDGKKRDYDGHDGPGTWGASGAGATPDTETADGSNGGGVVQYVPFAQ